MSASWVTLFGFGLYLVAISFLARWLARPFPWNLLSALALLLLLTAPFLVWPPYPNDLQAFPAAEMELRARTIALALYHYGETQEKGVYPSGSSSTDVFENLLNSGFIRDPAVFYLPMAGKVRPVPGQPLEAVNVCWDMTTPAYVTSPESLPVVFPTGYRIRYNRGAAAIPLQSPYPRYLSADPRSWWERWHGALPPVEVPVICVGYRNNAVVQFSLVQGKDGSYSIPHVVPPDFPKDKIVYHQLTPDGVLGE